MHGTRTTTLRRLGRIAACLLATSWLLSLASCGYLNKNGRGPVYLVIDSITVSSGARPSEFSNVLESDVITNVKAQIGGEAVLVPTVFEDIAKVFLHMSLKDPGTANSPTQPSLTNDITVTRYHVEFKRSDGRNVQGVDVPYAFDGAATGTFNTNGGSIIIAIVRANAKLEAPLMALRSLGGSVIISTIADVTLYGHDQNGNDVSVTGSVSVNFADWGDPGA